MCGAKRRPWDTTALNLTGKPAKYGGLAAKTFGCGALTVGWSVALLFGLVLQALWPAGWLGYAVAAPIALFTGVVGLVAILGGRRLQAMGQHQFETAQLDTVRGIASHHRGVVTAAQVARALEISETEADTMLTELAKRPEENVGLDVTDDGQILFLFGSSDAMRWRIKVERAGLSREEQARLEAEIEAEARAEAESQPARARPPQGTTGA